MELLLEIAVPVIAHIRSERAEIFSKGISDGFIADMYRADASIYPMIGNTVIIRPEFYCPVLVGRQGDTVIYVGNRGAAVERRRHRAADAFQLRGTHLRDCPAVIKGQCRDTGIYGLPVIAD